MTEMPILCLMCKTLTLKMTKRTFKCNSDRAEIETAGRWMDLLWPNARNSLPNHLSPSLSLSLAQQLLLTQRSHRLSFLHQHWHTHSHLRYQTRDPRTLFPPTTTPPFFLVPHPASLSDRKWKMDPNTHPVFSQACCWLSPHISLLCLYSHWLHSKYTPAYCAEYCLLL